MMFGQFVPTDEKIVYADYLGAQGVLWTKKDSFACLTDRRIASLMVGSAGEVVYQDGLLEHYNSGVIHQPSLLGLYLACAVVALSTCGVGLLLLPSVVRAYYRQNKCGLVWVIREGVSVYVFANRNRLSRANHLYRLVMQAYEARMASMPRRP